MILPLQVKAARAIVGMSQGDLADASGVGVATIKRLEADPYNLRGNAQTLVRLQRALEAAGVVLIEPDDNFGPGVRLRTSASSR